MTPQGGLPAKVSSGGVAELKYHWVSGAVALHWLQVGPRVLVGWFGHFAALTAYSVAHHLLRPVRTLTKNFTVHRYVCPASPQRTLCQGATSL